MPSLDLGDLHWAEPWAFIAVVAVLLMPIMSQVVSPGKTETVEDAFVSVRMRSLLGGTTNPTFGSQGASQTFLWLSALALALALARPQWGVLEGRSSQSGLEIVIAMDLSASMRAQDLHPSRLENARRELAFLIDSLHGHRVGLVGFAGTAFLFCPLTLDNDALDIFLDEMKIEAIPVPGTAIGDAIRVSLSAFQTNEDEPPAGRVILLLTDGEDHASKPLQAAEEAKAAGVIIDTVGIGTKDGATVPDEIGRSLRDDRGEVVVSRMDGQLLDEIAQLTGGVSLKMDGQTDGLGSYVDLLNRREKRLLGTSTETKRQERFQLFLGLAGFFFLVSLLLDERRKRL